MQNERQSEPVHRTNRSGRVTEQLKTNQRRHLERLFDGSAALKQLNWKSKRRDTYVSDIINVQSLLNIRAAQTLQRKRHHGASLQDRIVINVSGDRYETHRTTLELYPDTLLGNRERRKYYYDKKRNEYFFDRNRACFEAILYYYQSNGRLRRPNYVPIDTFLEEITFFQLGAEALNEIRKVENIKEVKKVRLPKNRFLRHLWATMEYPNYSIIAKIVNILSLLLILVSTMAVAIESLPYYTNLDALVCRKAEDAANNSLSTSSDDPNRTTYTSSTDAFFCYSYHKTPFFIIQTICVAFFTIELLLRVISTPSLCDYIKDLMNWIDVLAVVPYYISLGINSAGLENAIDTYNYIGIRFLRILRLARVFKFYRVFRGVKSFRVLASTFRQSIPDFFIMIIILTLLSLLFGAAAFYAENETNGTQFDSILKATYWGVITITSVGYGDISPITPIGRIISCLCALFGAATIGMLVSVLVDRYQRVFARKLYINEEIINFNDQSDDENNDIDSKGSIRLHRRNDTTKIEDPDARAKINEGFENENKNPNEREEVSQIPKENLLSQHGSRVRFIIGYVDDERNETSRDLLETITSVVAEKQTAGDNIQLSLLSDEEQYELSPYDVKFNLSSGEDTDNEEELTEIISGCGNRGNVLMKFQRPSSLKDNINKIDQLDRVEKNV